MTFYQRVRTMSQPNSVMELAPGHTMVTHSWNQKFSDCVVPNFHLRSAQGEVINNPMEKVVNETNTPPVYGEAYGHYSVQPWVHYEFQGYSDRVHHLPWPISSVDTSYEDGIAITQAHASVGDGMVDALVTGAELNETIQSLANTGIKAAKVFRAIRRFNLKALRKQFSPSEVRDQYLNFRYGLRPTYYDLRDIHEFLTVKRNKTDRRTSRGFHETSVTTESDTFWDINPVYFQSWTTRPKVRMCFKREAGYKITSRAGVLSSVMYSDDISRYLSELGVDRPISAAWELIPFSFMVDWFINIGDVIRSWEPKPYCKELASWCTTEVERYRLSTCNTVIFTDIGYKSVIDSQSFNALPHVESQVIRTRTVNPSLNVLPSINVRLNLAKIIDMGAIWHSLRKSTSRNGFRF